MLTRRQFLGLLATLPAMTALAGSPLRLPRTEEIEVTVDPRLIDPNGWYLKTNLGGTIPRLYVKTRLHDDDLAGHTLSGQWPYVVGSSGPYL